MAVTISVTVSLRCTTAAAGAGFVWTGSDVVNATARSNARLGLRLRRRADCRRCDRLSLHG